MIKARWTDHSGIHARRVESEHETLAAALNWLGAMGSVDGPNGPVTSREVEVDGRWTGQLIALCESHGLEPRFTRKTWGDERLIFAGARETH